MIKFIEIQNNSPFKVIEDLYAKALDKNQKNIEAVCLSSFDRIKNEVDSRFVNIKFINNDHMIFFTNYESQKSKQIQNHKQISLVFFWSSINIQIRIKAEIRKTSKSYNKEYFNDRSSKKNALAISSMQSQIISSYEEVNKNYLNALKI